MFLAGVHVEIRKYGCKYCEEKFNDSRSLKLHTRSHTGEKRRTANFYYHFFYDKTNNFVIISAFKCRFCAEQFVRSSDLNKHLRSHLGENIYECNECPISFPKIKDLREHRDAAHYNKGNKVHETIQNETEI